MVLEMWNGASWAEIEIERRDVGQYRSFCYSVLV